MSKSPTVLPHKILGDLARSPVAQKKSENEREASARNDHPDICPPAPPSLGSSLEQACLSPRQFLVVVSVYVQYSYPSCIMHWPTQKLVWSSVEPASLLFAKKRCFVVFEEHLKDDSHKVATANDCCCLIANCCSLKTLTALSLLSYSSYRELFTCYYVLCDSPCFERTGVHHSCGKPRIGSRQLWVSSFGCGGKIHAVL
jgi:hypothetical protein